MKTNRTVVSRQLARLRRAILRTLAFINAGGPLLVLAQYSEIKMGEYLNYATAAANGGVYAVIDGIGYVGVFGAPSLSRSLATAIAVGVLPAPPSVRFPTQITGTRACVPARAMRAPEIAP